MALAITGQTGGFAISSAMVKTVAAMASAAGDGNEYPCYHFITEDGSQAMMRQGSLADGPGSAVLEFVLGGQQGQAAIRLSQQNVIDLVAGMVTFANTGTLS